MPTGNIILSSDKVVDDCIKKIVSYTPSYSHTERIKIIQENLLPCNHPFIQNTQLYKKYASRFFVRKKSSTVLTMTGFTEFSLMGHGCGKNI